MKLTNYKNYKCMFGSKIVKQSHEKSDAFFNTSSSLI